MSLYEGSVKRPIMTSLIFTAIVVMGVFSLTKLPVNLFPDIDTNTIMVMTSYSGASAEDIELLITKLKLKKQRTRKIRWLSLSKPPLAEIRNQKQKQTL